MNTISHEQLMKFCSESDIRPYLRQPFSYNGKVYSTNGHMLVRVEPNGHSYETARMANGKDLGEGIEEILRSNPATSLIAIPEWDRDSEESRTCSACGGDGYYDAREFETKYDIQVLCEDCEGVGKWKKHKPVKIGNTHIDARYLRLIESLPNPRISFPDDTSRAVPFIFDGGVGLVMPMRV